MATPKKTLVKKLLEGGGERLKTEEAAESTEEEGGRKGGEGKVDPLLKIQRARWLEGGGSQSSSSSSGGGDWPSLRESLSIVHVLELSLGRLSPYERQRFGRKLREIPLEEGFVRIPEKALHEVEASRLGNLLLSYYGRTYAAKVAARALRAVGLKDEADRILHSCVEKLSLNLIQERGEAICCWFLEHVERIHRDAFQILQVAVHGSESPLFAEEGRSTKMEIVCNLCPCEDLPETIRPEMSHKKYRLHFTEAGSFLCFNTDVIFEVRGAVTITYHFDSWSKHLAGQNTEDWVVAGPLINIEADPAEAVAAVHFPHFLCLAGESDSQVLIAHFVEGGMSLEKPDRVGPYRVVLENPNFSPRGAIVKTSWFTRKTLVHTVALLYQMLQNTSPRFHLYLLPNDSSVRKAVHEHEEHCRSRRIDKPPWTLRPLKIGCRFFVETNDVRVCPKEVEFQYLDADKLQQYVELSATQMQYMFNFSVMEKRKNELIWEALVTQEDLKSPEMDSPLLHAAQGHCVERRAMKKTTRDHLVSTLENLDKAELKKFKLKLHEFPVTEDHDNIPLGLLKKADVMHLSQLLLGFYMEDYAVQVTVDVLNAINCRNEAQRLLSLTRRRN